MTYKNIILIKLSSEPLCRVIRREREHVSSSDIGDQSELCVDLQYPILLKVFITVLILFAHNYQKWPLKWVMKIQRFIVQNLQGMIEFWS